MSSIIPTKTALPDLLYTRFANTVDFHVSSTNFVQIVKDYTNLFALTKYYQSLQSTNDPISSEVKFWEEVLTGVNLRDKTINKITSTYISKIEAFLSPTDRIGFTGNEPNFIIEDNVLKVQIIDKDNKTRYIPVEDTKSEITEIIDNLSTSFTLDQIDNPEFLLYWTEMYKFSHSKVKELLSEKLDLDQTVLQDFSDCIANIVRQGDYFQPQCTPYFDSDFNFGIPSNLNPILDDKLSLEQQLLNKELTYNVNQLFRNNISKIISTTASTLDAHQSNLVTDTLHYQRINKIRFDYLENITDSLGKLYEVLMYMGTSNISNKQKILPITVEMVVEKNKVEVDLLMNKVQKIKEKVMSLSNL